jgi:hypothetical protein
MTREEAKEALEKGERITHIFFPKISWIEQKGEDYIYEDGFVMPIDLFWKYRENDMWKEDWTVIEKI